MKKRGQFQISFGMIFSIILIAVVIAIAVYVISNFLKTGKCVEAGILYEDLKKQVDGAWKSSIYRDFFEAEVPSGVEYVCFGEIQRSNKFREQYEYLRERGNRKDNVFLYPNENICGGDLSSVKINHVKIDGFFCAKVKNKKVIIKMEKSQFDSLVKLSLA